MILSILLSSAVIVITVLHYIRDVACRRDDRRLTARILRAFINEVTKDNLTWRIHSVKAVADFLDPPTYKYIGYVKSVADFLDPQKPQSKETK